MLVLRPELSLTRKPVNYFQHPRPWTWLKTTSALRLDKVFRATGSCRTEVVFAFFGFRDDPMLAQRVNIVPAPALDDYAEGSIPDALIGVPTNRTPEQIKQFQDYWDTEFAGDLAKRRRAKFVPWLYRGQGGADQRASSTRTISTSGSPASSALPFTHDPDKPALGHDPRVDAGFPKGSCILEKDERQSLCDCALYGRRYGR